MFQQRIRLAGIPALCARLLDGLADALTRIEYHILVR
jgi:hypothetical protein